jgi:hypothetical protein
MAGVVMNMKSKTPKAGVSPAKPGGQSLVAAEVSDPVGLATSSEVLTVAGLAEYLKLSEAVVLSEAAAGRLPGRCIGGEWRFLLGAVNDWLAICPTPNGTKSKPRPRAGVGRDFDEDPEEVIASIYALRKSRRTRT